MTYHYNPRTPILGTTLGTYRKVLLAWEKEEDLGELPARLGVGEDTMALIVDDAEARGLFGVTDGEYGATPAGKEFLKGVTTRRMTAAQAQGLLDGLLDNVAAMNADRRNPLMIERVWLFGSLAQGKPDCGDVDIVVEESPRPRGEEAYEAFRRDIVRLAREMGGAHKVARSEFRDWAAADHVMEKSLFGARRDPRLVGHAMWDLRALGCPCKVVFDRGLGGRVDGPLLDRHPETLGSGEAQPAKGVVPDMSVPAPAEPCAMRIAVERARMGLGLDLLDRGPWATRPRGPGRRRRSPGGWTPCRPRTGARSPSSRTRARSSWKPAGSREGRTSPSASPGRSNPTVGRRSPCPMPRSCAAGNRRRRR